MSSYDGLPFEMSTEATRTPYETVLPSSAVEPPVSPTPSDDTAMVNSVSPRAEAPAACSKSRWPPGSHRLLQRAAEAEVRLVLRVRAAMLRGYVELMLAVQI